MPGARLRRSLEESDSGRFPPPSGPPATGGPSAGDRSWVADFRLRSGATTLLEVARQCESLDKDEFVRLFPQPFLVQQTRNRATAKDARFVTLVGVDTGEDRLDPLQAPVYYLTKKDRNGFQSMITIGRTENNDVTLDSSRVSKFHAYFSEVAEAWYVTDSDSRNGSFLAGQPLVPRQATALQNGIELAFSREVIFTFHDSASMFDHLVTVRESPGYRA